MAASDRSIESRIRHLEDIEEIRALFDAYRRALDAKDFRAYADLYARNGTFVAGDMVARGREEIYQLVVGMLGTLLTEHSGDDFHLISNVNIDVDGDQAAATSTWSYIVRGPHDEPMLVKVGHYEDTLVREDGAWRFMRRCAPTDIPALG